MKAYFNFSRGQKIGVVTLAIIIVIQIVFLNKGSGISIPDPFVISTEQYKLIDSSNSNYKKNKKYNFKKDYVLTQFDPNSYNVDNWINIGFSDKQASIIVNYKNKINGFKDKSDVKNVFVINEKKYKELEPFLDIKELKRLNENQFIESVRVDEPLVIFELNSASIDDLISIKGIGEFTAKGIIKQKQLIGGFHSVSQIKEVYGIEDKNYEKIITQLEVDHSSIVKIKINELSIFELKKHHYISWNMAEAIINKRLMKRLTNLDFLISDEEITTEKLEVLLPYIDFE